MDQQLPLKEQLVILIRSSIAAATSGDSILVQYANSNLSKLLESIDVIAIDNSLMDGDSK